MQIIQQIDELLKKERYPYSYNTIISTVSSVLVNYDWTPRSNKRITKEEFIKELCKLWGTNILTLKIGGRKKDIIYKRYVIIYYLRYIFRMYVTEIGNYMYKDHSTISCNLQATKNLIDTNDETFNQYLSDANKIIEINKILT